MAMRGPGFRSLLLVLVLAPARASADGPITLGEVLPALAGTELGALELGPAPPPGSSRTVRGSEIRSALRQAGRDVRGLAIPAATRVERAARRLEGADLEALVTQALDRAVHPCRVSELALAQAVTVAPGELTATTSASPPPRSGRIAARVVLSAGGHDVELHVGAEASCPAPVVAPGDAVQIVARAGRVRAVAPGVAAQPGRAGDLIRVTNRLSRVSLLARVRGSGVVEVER